MYRIYSLDKVVVVEKIDKEVKRIGREMGLGGQQRRGLESWPCLLSP